jgi:hypothetical protein
MHIFRRVNERLERKQVKVCERRKTLRQAHCQEYTEWSNKIVDSERTDEPRIYRGGSFKEIELIRVS